MQLYLIRHAESENNAKPIYERIEDPPLTPVGRMQAEYLANWLQSLAIDTLITSPVLRALQTTRFIVNATQIHVHVWADMYEEGGIYRGHGPEAVEGGPGLTRSEVLRHVTENVEACTLDDAIVESGWWGKRDRETPEQAHERADRVKQRLIDSFGTSGETIVAVIHADFKRRLLSQLLGDRVDVLTLGHLCNTGITKLDFHGDHWMLEWFNSVGHLPWRLITSGQ